MNRRWLAALLVASCPWLVAGCGAAPSAVPPVPTVGVWYHGQPAGTPQRDDLAVMKALDFSAVTWPSASTANVDELRQLAKAGGLAVVIRDRPEPLTWSSALSPGEHIDVAISKTPAEAIVSLIWRAVAHGARVVAFDPGDQTGSGLANVNGEMPAWIPSAKAVTRQISFNPSLITALQPGPAVTIEAPRPADLDVVLLQVERSWLIVATSASAAPVKVTVHLPAVVPYALWVSMLDGSNMAMLNTTNGPTWSLELPAYGAAVYVIDKKLK